MKILKFLGWWLLITLIVLAVVTTLLGILFFLAYLVCIVNPYYFLAVAFLSITAGITWEYIYNN